MVLHIILDGVPSYSLVQFITRLESVVCGGSAASGGCHWLPGLVREIRRGKMEKWKKKKWQFLSQAVPIQRLARVIPPLTLKNPAA